MLLLTVRFQRYPVYIIFVMFFSFALLFSETDDCLFLFFSHLWTCVRAPFLRSLNWLYYILQYLCSYCSDLLWQVVIGVQSWQACGPSIRPLATMTTEHTPWSCCGGILSRAVCENSTQAYVGIRAGLVSLGLPEERTLMVQPPSIQNMPTYNLFITY